MVESPAQIPDRFLDDEKALACIHCGLCLSSCPTYLETGNENDSPRGRIYLMRAIQDGRLDMNDTSVGHVDLCLGCRACEAACPSGVQYGELLETTRDHIEKRHKRSVFQTILRRFVIERIFPFPRRLKLALVPAMIIRGLRLQVLLPKFARDALELIPSQWASEDSTELHQSVAGPRKGKVGFVDGCVMSVMFAKTNANSIRLLNAAGFEAVIPKSQSCCGALYAHSGQLEQARESARRNIDAFEAEKLDAIVINAAGCGSTLKEYAHLLKDDPKYAARAKVFNDKVRDLTEFLAEHPVPNLSTLSSNSLSTYKVTYHDACHLAHAQGISKQPRDLVKEIAGDYFVELPESDVCCGSAGTYNLTEPAMAERLQERKIQNILKTEARIVVTSNPGCMLQIQAGLRKAGRDDIEVRHIADYLASNKSERQSS
ncbi:MAG: (Fe-S)-binding protein [Verrucomicrobiia bacterium]